jgi:hypothetical protein
MLDLWHISDPRDRAVTRQDRRRPRRRPARADAQHFDRLLPGDGVSTSPRPFRALERPGYDGWYDVEIFSDNGVFGELVPRRRSGRRRPELARAPPARASNACGSSVSRRYDAVAIGSGINSLVAAALLREGGLERVRARAERLARRAIRTAEITEPGFVHEVLARGIRLFTGSAAYAELKDDLEARGLEYVNTELRRRRSSRRRQRVPHGRRTSELAALGPAWERTVGRVHAERRSRVRRPLDRAVVA